jgi:hypothetical protein
LIFGMNGARINRPLDLDKSVDDIVAQASGLDTSNRAAVSGAVSSEA